LRQPWPPSDRRRGQVFDSMGTAEAIEGSLLSARSMKLIFNLAWYLAAMSSQA